MFWKGDNIKNGKVTVRMDTIMMMIDDASHETKDQEKSICILPSTKYQILIGDWCDG